jgi:hypothetical protein
MTLKKILLILLAGILGAVSGSCLTYLVFKRVQDHWTKLPTPPQNATSILAVLVKNAAQNDFVVFLRTDDGTLYSCGYAEPSCSPSGFTEKQIAEMVVKSGIGFYPEPEPQRIPSSPHGRIMDVCQFSGVEALNTVILLEDHSLWYQAGAPIDVASLACPFGACLGGLLGPFVGLVLARLIGQRAQTQKS